jgi:uncharacterized protein YcbK (DUF882 family)
VYDHWKEIPSTRSAWPWRYFSPQEMACRGTGQIKVAVTLLNRLDVLRNRFGAALDVLSGYRSPYHNAVVGGAPLSRHVIGDAVDISTADLDRDYLERLARGEGFTGFGYYETFLHIDLGRPRKWGINV